MKSILYGIIGIALTGCTVGPNYHVPTESVPSHYSSTARDSSQPTTAETHFFEASLNDPQLVRLVDKAIRGDNLDIQKSLANIREARAELAIVRADYLPELDVTGRVSRDRLSANSEILSSFPPGVIPLSYTDYRFGFDASWEIDLFGHTRRSVEASAARFQSSIENQQNVRLAVASEVARTYTQYRVYQQRIGIANQTIHSYDETLQLVNLQQQAGSATGVDVHRVESELLSAKAAVPPLQAEAKSTLAALAVLVGEQPEALFAELNATAPIPVMSARQLSVGLPSVLLQRRPDIRVAERELAAATADVGVAVANQFPRFQLVGDIGSETTKPGTYFKKASVFWSAGPQVSLPIFEGGRLRSAVKAQEAARDVALATYKQTVLQALADVESSLTRYHREKSKKYRLLASYHKLQSVHRLVRLQYREGQSSLLDVLDVERQLNDLHDQYVQSLGQETIDLVALYKALGGDWQQKEITA
jgi:NodT family efflux transporter outer membrane factor (OMF) lipoprotein